MPGAVFLDAMGATSPGVTFVPRLVEAMRAAKGRGIDVYARNDSHWTPYGSGVAYRELMAHILPLRDARVVPSSEVRFKHRWSYGDLGAPVRSGNCVSSSRWRRFSTPEPERLVQRSGAQRQTVTATPRGGTLRPDACSSSATAS